MLLLLIKETHEKRVERAKQQEEDDPDEEEQAPRRISSAIIPRRSSLGEYFGNNHELNGQEQMQDEAEREECLVQNLVECVGGMFKVRNLRN